MGLLTRKSAYRVKTFLLFDLKASVTVFFVALPLCLGIAMASGAPVFSGLIAGVIGGTVVSLISGSSLSVSGPAAGLTAICAAAISELSLPHFFLAVALAGIIQIVLGMLRLGGFTHFIPSSVIKGMLAAIGILLISKQIPIILGYNKPDFWTNELVNIVSFRHGFREIKNFTDIFSSASILLTILTFSFMAVWQRITGRKLDFLPEAFMIVLSGSVISSAIGTLFPSIRLQPSQYVQIPHDLFTQMSFPDIHAATQTGIIKNAALICFVATLETLLSLEAIDKLDPYNRVSPQNRELVAQGVGNMFSGFLGGLPITAVIVRSSANAEAGAKTKGSAFVHGLWLVLALAFATPLINHIPYCVLALILLRTGFHLAKPGMFQSVYRQGREQFMPFIVTILAILLTDLLIGVFLGFIYAIYFLVKHTYHAGFVVKKTKDGRTETYHIDLALNVSFLNKKRLMEYLDHIPPYSEININAEKTIYIDHDVLEIFQDFRTKARNRHINLTMINIPEVETIELH